jgi:hypothetical protein
LKIQLNYKNGFEKKDSLDNPIHTCANVASYTSDDDDDAKDVVSNLDNKK